MNDKLNITIRIANQAPIPLAIKREDEEVVRTAEYNVNRLWNSWSTKFKSKSSTEVLAMVAFRFAELFFTQSAMAQNAAEVLGAFESRLDGILLDVGDPAKEL
ncbi:MAG: cell division protein ZapA [Muribaculaceae bacterium]|nr:cell division protein ZapA [Muribaculaceae bacterium]